MRQINFFLAVICFFFIGCEKNVVTELQVIVMNNQNSPIKGATVVLDDKKLGVTSTEGTYTHKIKEKEGRTLRLEVVKSSETHYYAPFIHKFVISPEDEKHHKVKAILYSVPKPKEGVSLSEHSEREDDIAIFGDGLIEKEISDLEDIAVEAAKMEPDLIPEKAVDSVSSVQVKPPPSYGSTVQDSNTVDDKLANSNLQTELPVTPYHIKKDEPFKSDLQVDSYMKKRTLINFHIVSDKRSIANADIFLGFKKRSFLQLACKTNAQGACSVALPFDVGQKELVVVKKYGFESKQTLLNPNGKGIQRIELNPGHTVDVFALKNDYSNLRGVSNVEVLINGVSVGKTNRYGHFSYPRKQIDDQLVRIELRNSKYYPEVYAAEMALDGSFSINKYYTKKTPPKPLMVLLPLKFAGDRTFSIDEINKFEGELNDAARRYFFKNAFSSEFPFKKLRDNLDHNQTRLSDILKRGWSSSTIESDLDILLQPTVFSDPDGSGVLELSAVDKRGHSVAAARVNLLKKTEKKDLRSAMERLARDIGKIFPYEGAILSNAKKEVKINLSKSNIPGFRTGDIVEIFGISIDEDGREYSQQSIGLAKVHTILPSHSVAELIWTKDRSIVSRGDQVVVQRGYRGIRKDGDSSQMLALKIVEGGDRQNSKPLSNVNVYLNGSWLASSDHSGKAYSSSTITIKDDDKIELVKHGYRKVSVDGRSITKNQHQVSMEQVSAYVNIESTPEGADVKVDGIQIGKTPIKTPITVRSGFVEIVVGGISGVKPYVRTLELEEGTLDLTGPRAIALEVDVLAKAEQLVKNKKHDQALEILEQCPQQHSDYYYAQHLAGEIYLADLSQPKKAVAAFGRVVQSDRLSPAQRSHFVGSYLNQAVAHVKIADQALGRDKAEALLNYEAAEDLLEKSSSLIRHVSPKQVVLAKSQSDYYRAHTKMQIALLTENEDLRHSATRMWSDFVQSYRNTNPAAKEVKSLYENAEVFLKQARVKNSSQARKT